MRVVNPHHAGVKNFWRKNLGSKEIVRERRELSVMESFRGFPILFVLLLIVTISSSCFDRDADKLAAIVVEIRKKIATGDVQGVYQSSSAEFRAAVKLETFLSEIGPISKDVGSPDRFELVERLRIVDVRYGYLMKLTYRSRIDNSVIESDEFFFKKESGDWKLYNYAFTRREPNR